MVLLTFAKTTIHIIGKERIIMLKNLVKTLDGLLGLALSAFAIKAGVDGYDYVKNQYLKKKEAKVADQSEEKEEA